MRVIIDTNVYLSYILAPGREGVITTVVAACFRLDEIDLVAPPQQIAEFAGKAASKRYFRSRIPQALIEHFVAQLNALTALQPPPDEAAVHTRDPKDDYLITYGVVNEVDYLITGDQDLLVIGRAGQLQIVTPVGFLGILQREHLL
jgi:putative PIN family toxin of toxin-antitoxin system